MGNSAAIAKSQSDEKAISTMDIASGLENLTLKATAPPIIMPTVSAAKL